MRNKVKNACLMTAVKTPYLENGKFDLETYDRLLEKQVKYGVDGVIVGGTTGEGHLMSWDEHIMLIAHTVNKFGKDLVIVGNTGSNNTREAIHATEQGFAVGMDATLQINPYYGKTSESGLKTHFSRVFEIGPTIIYNVPGRTSQDISDELILEFAKHPNFIGVKECMGNERIASYEAKGIACWSGNDDQCFESRHKYNSHGVISVTSNVVPGLMKQLLTNDDKELNQRLQPLFKWMFKEPNPIPLDTIMAMLGMIKPVFRLPYVPVSDELRKEAIKIIEELKAPELDGKIEEMKLEDFLLI